MNASIAIRENCTLLELCSCVRYYNPETGRWLSEDPKRFNGDDYNFYRYVKNNPIINVDPSGEFLITAIAIGLVLILPDLTGHITPVPVELIEDFNMKREGEDKLQEWIRKKQLEKLKDKWEEKTGEACGVA